jgi:epoxide hydrolase 4
MLPPDRRTSRIAMTDTSLQHREIALADVRLHCVEAGSGPLVLLLHGFPEFWYTWRHLIPALAGAGFRVVAPDLRGVNTSSKPEGIAAYAIDVLVKDIHDLIGALGAERAHVVGHDWGSGIAWSFAMQHPERLNRLAILNGPHPQRLLSAMRQPSQLRKSWYMFFFQLPYLPERIMSSNGYARLLAPMQHDPVRPGAYSADDIARYRDALAQPGALTAFINYYRAMRKGSRQGRWQPIHAETLIIWGDQDKYLGRDLAAPDPRLVTNARVEYMPDATHWVHHDQPERVATLLIEFLKRAP